MHVAVALPEALRGLYIIKDTDELRKIVATNKHGLFYDEELVEVIKLAGLEVKHGKANAHSGMSKGNKNKDRKVAKTKGKVNREDKSKLQGQTRVAQNEKKNNGALGHAKDTKSTVFGANRFAALAEED